MQIRQAKAGDAEALLNYLEKLLNEPDHNGPTIPGEFSRSTTEQVAILQSFVSEPNSTYFLAESENKIVGEISLRGNQRKALSHSAVLGMSVSREHRGKGIGSSLLSSALEWAANTPLIERIELAVLSTNNVAIQLYRNSGFQEEGRRKQMVKFGPSNYVDDILMAKFV